jgi:hypothetical protein
LLLSQEELGNCPAVFVVSAEAADSVLDLAELCKEPSNFLTLKSAVTPEVNVIGLYSSGVTPPPQGVRMDMEEPGYFSHRHHFTHMFAISHIFSALLFD